MHLERRRKVELGRELAAIKVAIEIEGYVRDNGTWKCSRSTVGITRSETQITSLQRVRCTTYRMDTKYIPGTEYESEQGYFARSTTGISYAGTNTYTLGSYTSTVSIVHTAAVLRACFDQPHILAN